MLCYAMLLLSYESLILEIVSQKQMIEKAERGEGNYFENRLQASPRRALEKRTIDSRINVTTSKTEPIAHCSDVKDNLTGLENLKWQSKVCKSLTEKCECESIFAIFDIFVFRIWGDYV